MIKMSHNTSGFTLIELIAVLIMLGIISAIATVKFLDLKKEAEYAALQSQAGNLISNNNLNVSACQVGSPQCVDITTTGKTACEDGLAEFMPQVDTDIYGVTNIDSDTSKENWQSAMDDKLDDKELGAIYWVDRFLETPPDDDWLDDGWNTRQPCIIYVK